MEYEKKYKEALKWVQKLYPSFEGWVKEDAEHYFPELKSEDEKIRKAIHIYLDWLDGRKDYQPKGAYTIKDMIAWLEKQKERSPLLKDEEYTLARIIEYLEENDCPSEWKDLLYDVYALPYQKEQKPADKVEPKFHPGNWIVDDETPNDVFCVIEVLGEIYKVIDIDGDDYHIPHCKADKQFHLWSISDAKDGDVLTDGKKIVIFNKFEEPTSKQRIIAYAGLDLSGKLQITEETKDSWRLADDRIMPATKERRDLLFQKIKEAGYQWDTDKKELKKIEPKTLNADNVIEWLNHHELSRDDVVTSVIPDDSPTSVPHRVKWLSDEFIKQFKKYFEI